MFAVLLGFVVAGCAVPAPKVLPVARPFPIEICVIENPRIRQGFLDAYQSALEAKGFHVRIVPPSGAVGDCALFSRYTADWNWDLAVYLKSAMIWIYSDEHRVAGQAIYNTGYFKLGMYASAKDTVTELVDQLFPGTVTAP